jgi:hypothetical protein
MPDITEFVLTPDGIERRRIITSRSVNPDEIIRRLAVRTAAEITNVFDYEGTPVHLRAANGFVSIAFALKRVVLNTRYKIKDNNLLTPTFGRDTESLTADAAFEIPLPPNQVYMVWNSEVNACYLVYIDERGIYKLPLPNTYEDGKLCSGDGVLTIRNHTGLISERVGLLVKLFEESPWNADLINGRVFDDLLEFTPEGTLVTCGIFDRSNLVSISNETYNWLGKIYRATITEPL